MDTAGAQVVSWSEFGDQLRRWRSRANLSQIQVAARVGYHHSLISKLESGTRKPSPHLVRRLDEVLGTGGGLAQALALDGERQWAGLDEAGPFPPSFADIDLGNLSGWPSRLPSYGVLCPLHGVAGCEVPPGEEAIAAYAAFAGSRGAVTTDTVHVLTALLASCARTQAERASPGVATPVEVALRALIRAVQTTSSRVLLQLAAAFAVLAGQQRMARGQHGAAMTWYGRGLHWSGLADDIGVRVDALCDMSTLSRLEFDAPNALGYAKAMRPLERDRVWVSTLASLFEARSRAQLGDFEATSRHIGLAREGLTRLGERDGLEAPWLCGSYGKVLVEAGAGAALRDVAAATADQAMARSAIKATEWSLIHMPPHMRVFRTLMTLRLADSHACAGEPEAAVAVALPVVDEAGVAPTACIRQEMHGLRSRLVTGWGEHPHVRSFAEQSHGYAA